MSCLNAALARPHATEARGVRAARAGLPMFSASAARNVSVGVLAQKPPMLGDQMRPDKEGRYGKFGGKYVPETLIPALEDLTEEYERAMKDDSFKVRLQVEVVWSRCLSPLVVPL